MYKNWTTVRLLHYYFWQPNYDDRQYIIDELIARGFVENENGGQIG